MKATIVGAGFSGLTTAYYLQKKGFDVEVIESSSAVGGLISTVKTEMGLCETAANGILNSILLENLANETGVTLIQPNKEAKKRFIYRAGLKHSRTLFRWPLKFLETLRMILGLLLKRKKPRPHESVKVWGNRVLGQAASKHLLATALQGVYAGNPDTLSSSLILGRFFSRKKEKVAKPKMRGTVAPQNGMGELLGKIKSYLENKGAMFRFNTPFVLNKYINSRSKGDVLIICTGAKQAAQIFSQANTPLTNELGKIQMLPMISATVFFMKSLRDPLGFGCLFPRSSGARALGVLFNNCIFEGRSFVRSETWIFNQNELSVDEQSLSDSEFVDLIKSERFKFLRVSSKALYARVQRWPEGIPYYSTQLENVLENIKPHLNQLKKENIFLHGNYLGSIGLSNILKESAHLPNRILDEKVSP